MFSVAARSARRGLGSRMYSATSVAMNDFGKYSFKVVVMSFEIGFDARPLLPVDQIIDIITPIYSYMP